MQTHRNPPHPPQSTRSVLFRHPLRITSITPPPPARPPESSLTRSPGRLAILGASTHSVQTHAAPLCQPAPQV